MTCLPKSPQAPLLQMSPPWWQNFQHMLRKLETPSSRKGELDKLNDEDHQFIALRPSLGPKSAYLVG